MPQKEKLTVAAFETHASATDQLDPRIDTPVLGLVGEVGSLVSALKKKRRDTDGFFGYREAVVEELGDVLWYVSAIARRGGTSLVEVIGRAGGGAQAADGLLFVNLCVGRRIAEGAFEAALLELSGEAGDLAKRFAAGAYRNNTDALRGDLIGFGADDYLTKPFHKDELLARIRAVVRRSADPTEAVIRCGDLVVYPEHKRVEIARRDLDLTRREYEIVELLASRQGAPIANETFLTHMYGGMDEPKPKIIDVFICKIRKRSCKLVGAEAT